MYNNTKDYKRYVSESSFVAIHEIEPVLIFDKPVYVGFSILVLSKLLMYKFLYKYIGIKYDNSAKLLSTDRYSLVYEIETDDVYENFCENKSLFDFSD